jgi:hypothetical protein
MPNFPTNQSLPAGATPAYLSINGEAVSPSNPLPTAVGLVSTTGATLVSNFPTQQNLPQGAVPVYLAYNGQAVSPSNPIPTTTSGNIPDIAGGQF